VLGHAPFLCPYLDPRVQPLIGKERTPTAATPKGARLLPSSIEPEGPSQNNSVLRAQSHPLWTL
jgi:hypothetical protein